MENRLRQRTPLLRRAVKFYLACLTFGATLLSGCSEQNNGAADKTATIPQVAFNGTNAMNEVKAFVEIGPRDTGSAGMLIAVLHIEKKLKSWGYIPTVDPFEASTPAGPLTVRNIYAVRKGKTDKTLILVSHTDTKAGVGKGFVGANDSGSSTGVLLEMARHFSANDITPSFNIMFAFVDGEECSLRYGPRDGLHGSRHLANKLKNEGKVEHVIGVVVIDMIGDKNLTVSITDSAVASISPETRKRARSLSNMTLTAARKLGYTQYFRFDRATIIDDHQPFLNVGIPAIDLIDFEYGSQPKRNDYWHTQEDTLDKLSVKSLRIIGETLLQVIADLQQDEH